MSTETSPSTDASGTAGVVLERLGRTTDRVVGVEDFIARLESGRRLRVKFGVDCTAPDLHIGHAVNLWMMRYLQELGHTVVFLLGDVTTRIGDPTGRSATRPVLAPEVIEDNARKFTEQVSMVLRTDADVFEVRRNSEWYGGMAVSELLGLFELVTVAQLTARDMFRERAAAGREIGLHELVYPVLQAYDSVALGSDLTIVGSDQLFNETLARQVQQRLGAEPQCVITTRITPGLDGGAKQSKSLGNYVALLDTPEDKFGKLMSIGDDVVGEYAQVYTDLPMEQVRRLREDAAAAGTAARDAKLGLAESVVARYHGAETARRCRLGFTSTFAGGNEPEDMPELHVSTADPTVLEVLKLARPDSSNSELRRLIAQGAVSLDGIRIDDPEARAAPDDGATLRIGKRSWHRLRIGG